MAVTSAMEFLRFPVSARGLRAVRLPRLPLLTAGTATHRVHDRIGTVLLLGQYLPRVAWTRALHDMKHPLRTECSAFEPASDRPEHRGEAMQIRHSPRSTSAGARARIPGRVPMGKSRRGSVRARAVGLATAASGRQPHLRFTSRCAQITPNAFETRCSSALYHPVTGYFVISRSPVQVWVPAPNENTRHVNQQNVGFFRNDPRCWVTSSAQSRCHRLGVLGRHP
jgi:hypothetical protein